MADDSGHSQQDPALFAPSELLAGRFLVVREVARGGMGVVYEAWDEKLERRIAIKAARAGLAGFLSPEVRNASTVSHPNICRIFEIHSTRSASGDVDFVTMEYVEGETLALRLARGALPDAEARAIALQLCAGLTEAHRNGVIHGDLKPQNIILSHAADGAVRAVITDFGLAQGPRQRGSSGGTPGYMAPELVVGGSISVATDIFAMGVILHELVTGLRPRERADELSPTITAPAGNAPAPTHSRLPMAQWSQPQPMPLGSRWDPIFKRCLAQDPTARFADVAALQLALDPPRGRRGVIAWALLVVVLAVCVAYWKVSAPATTVKLAVHSTLDLHDALQRLRRTRARGYHIVSKAGSATHLLNVDAIAPGDTVVAVDLIDARTHAKLAHWDGVFATDERAYAPAAIAGLVSATLHLTTPTPRFIDPEASREYERALPLLRQDDQLDSARTLMQLAAVAEPSSALPWAGSAEAEWRKFYLTRAEEWLTRCKESVRRAELRGMDAPEVHRIAGLLEANDGRFAQAITRYQRAIELPSTNSDAWRRLGEAYRRNNQPDLALTALRKAVEVEPGYYRTHQDLGSWYFTRGEYRPAIPELEAAARLAPTVPRAHSSLATALMNVGEFKSAENELRAALGLKEDATVMHSLGQVLMYQSRDGDAIPFFRRAFALDSTQFLSALYLGNCLLRTGRIAESRTAYARSFVGAEREVERAPQNGYNRGFLAYLCARRGDSLRAGDEVAQALKTSPEVADVLWEAALTYETLGRHDDAISVLRSAPRDLLEDLSRWPEAAPLVRDERFQQLLHASQRTP